MFAMNTILVIIIVSGCFAVYVITDEMRNK